MRSGRQICRIYLAMFHTLYAGALLGALGTPGNAAGFTDGLADIQVGENGTLTRVALACDVECFVVRRGDGAFFVTDIQADLSVDLLGRANNADRLVLTPVAGGSVLEIVGRGAVVHSAITDCLSGGQKGKCIDLTFEKIPPRRQIATPTPSRDVVLRDEYDQTFDDPTLDDPAFGDPAFDDPAFGGSDIEDVAVPTDEIPFLGVAMTPTIEAPPSEKFLPAPALRDQTGFELLQIGKLAPPERFSPPTVSQSSPQMPESQEAVAKSIRDGSKRIQSRGVAPTPKDRAEEILAVSFDINEEAEKILGKKIDTGSCAVVRATLQADAWALDAMVDRGLCLGAEGKLVEADAIFQRLLAYTPDNYEALVGRALVAADQGETQLALKYFQNALNALPPVAESRRIVSFMQRISYTQ